jgi:glycosyltransferase involved in cell wall biosynthesis
VEKPFVSMRATMLTVFPDFREEGWHSMDLCADMLVKHAPVETELKLSAPRYRNLLGFLPSKQAKNFDRLYNRWRVYPSHVKKFAAQPGFFHIVDHSYAHLAHFLPEGRVGIYCHDLDAFRCVLTPEQEPRSKLFRKMMACVFEGFKKARIVFCNTKTTQKKILELGIWKASDVVHVPLGVAEEFSPWGDREKGDYLLHVGSCIPRKRIDVLLRAFGEVCKKANNLNLKLIQAGGDFSSEHRKQIQDLGLINRVEQRQNLTRQDLARLYRGAKCLVITSDSEGFGLPVIEGLSCGARIVASDIPALREVGGCEVELFPPSDYKLCAEKIFGIFKKLSKCTNKGLEKFSWSNHTKIICDLYKTIQ